MSSLVGNYDITKTTPQDRELLSSAFDVKLSPFRYGLPAGISLGVSQNTVTAWATNKLIQQEYMNDGSKLLQPQEVKDIYGVDAKEPITESYAKYKREQQQRRLMDENIVSLLDTDRFGSSAFPIAGQFMGSMMDPLGILATSAIVAGGGLALGGVAASGLAGSNYASKMLSFFNMNSIKGAVATGLAEGVVDSIVTTPLIMGNQQEIYDESIGASDVLTDVIYNLAGNTLFSVGGYGLKKMFDKYSPKGQQDITATAMSQASSGKTPDTTPLEVAMIKDNLTTRPDQVKKDFVKSDVPQADYYAPSRNGKTLTIDENFGSKGIVITDDVNVASNTAAPSLAKNSGEVLQIRAENLKLLDIDLPVTEDIIQTARNVLTGEIDDSLLDEVLSGRTTREIIDALRDTDIYLAKRESGVLDQFNAVMESKGFDGYSFTGGKLPGAAEVSPDLAHNSAFIFDSKKAKVVAVNAVEAPEKGYNAQVELQQSKDYMESKRSQVSYDEDAELEMADISEDFVPDFSRPLKEVLDEFEQVRTLYHGTNTNYEKFDARKSAGMVFLAERPQDAARYAMGGGGNRAYLPQSEKSLDVEGVLYDWDESIGKFSIREKTKGEPDTVSIQEAEELSRKWMASVVPRNPILKVVQTKAKVLDSTLDIGDLDGLHKRLLPHRMAEDLRSALIKNDPREFGGAWWRLTKYSTDERRAEVIQIVGEFLNEKGYDGLRFFDDSHKTVMLTSQAQIKYVDDLIGHDKINSFIESQYEVENLKQTQTKSGEIAKAAAICTHLRGSN